MRSARGAAHVHQLGGFLQLYLMFYDFGFIFSQSLLLIKFINQQFFMIIFGVQIQAVITPIA